MNDQAFFIKLVVVQILKKLKTLIINSHREEFKYRVVHCIETFSSTPAG